VEKGATLIGEPIFLEAAVGFVREGHFEETGGEERLDMTLVVEAGVGEASGFREILPWSGTCGRRL
jgi:hypothetical protein